MRPLASPGYSAGRTLKAGRAGSVPALQALFPDADAYTIQFGLSGVKPGVQAQALITWKTEGNTVSRRITIANGTSITGVAQAVEVSLSDCSLTVANGAEYTVTVTAAHGARASFLSPPQLVAYDPDNGFRFIVAAGASAVIPIPVDAGACSAFVTVTAVPFAPIPDETAIVIMANGTLPQHQYDTQRLQGSWVPLPPSADSLELFALGSQSLAYAVTFAIDG